MYRHVLAYRGTVCGLAALAAAHAWAAVPKYRIVDLAEQTGIGLTEARSINAANEVVGAGFSGEFTQSALYWDAQQQPYVLPLLPGDNSADARRITDAGLILGSSSLVTVKYVGDKIFIIVDAKAVAWQSGLPTDLNSLVIGGADLYLRSAQAEGGGRIVGTATPPGQTAPRGFLLQDGIVTDLGVLDVGQAASYPNAINAKGQVAGWSSDSQSKAFLWEDGVLTNLHKPPITGVTSRAWDINDGGLIVGEAQFKISDAESPALWKDGVAISLVGTLFARPQGVAAGINNKGQIVGWYTDLDDLDFNLRGFLCQDGQFHELLDLLVALEGWNYPMLPFEINEAGWMVGRGFHNGKLDQAFLMFPIGVVGDLNCDGLVNAFDIDPFVLALTDPAGYEAAYPDCDRSLADINGDGAVDAFDIDPFVDLLTGA